MRSDLTPGLLGGLAAGLALAGLAALAVARLRRWRGLRRSLRGRRLEGEASRALERAGFRLVRHRPVAEYDLQIDGEPRAMRLEGDYLVARGGRRFLVEVKSGQGADPARRSTRRQLLEYAMGFDVDGVLLFDAERGRLHRVEFPLGPRPARTGGWWFALGAALGLGAGALWFH
jgi:hypothetical protein